MTFLEEEALLQPRAVKVNESYCFWFGFLCVQVLRHPHEWHIEYCYAEPAAREGWLVCGELKLSRFITDHSPQQEAVLAIAPKLADRSIVSRPVNAVEILPDHTATVYVSTTLWLGLSVDNQPLLELPAQRLSDTWFGPNTREGELCYASSTRARLDAELLEALSHKAITPIVIKNESVNKLSLERLNVPVPSLTLYRVNGDYWTSPVVATIEAELNRAKLDIRSQPLQRGGQITAVCAPRKVMARGVFHRAVDLLLA